MGLVEPCTVSTSPLNTGHDCQVRMSAPRLIIMVPQSAKWTSTNEASFFTYLKARIADVPSKRWFPLFGNSAPIRTINDNNETDIIVDYDDGSKSFIRNGTMSRTFLTNKGGLEFAKALMSFNAFSGQYAFIEIDSFNHVLRHVNADGTFSGVPCNMAAAPSPTLAGLKTEFMAAFAMNWTAENYISEGGIMTSEEDLLDLSGLVLAEITLAAAATTTKLKFGVRTVDAQVDLVALYDTALAVVSNFVVTKVSDGSSPSVTAAAIVGTHLELTGTFVSAAGYTVALAAPSVLLGNSIEGYDGTGGSLVITIP